jgi:hypothetical protein
MARTNIPVTSLVANGGIVTDPAGTTVDPTNGHIIGPRVSAEQIVIRVSNTFAGTKTVTLKASANSGSISAGQGDLAMSIPATSVRWIGPFESMRFFQAKDDTGAGSAGYLYLDVQSGTTGTVSVFSVPRNA